MMAEWKSDELTRIGSAEEVEIEVRGRGGRLRPGVTVWLVRSGDDLYIRSAVKGRSAAWFGAVQKTHEGRISGGGASRDVRFEEPEPSVNAPVDAAYRTKYSRYTGRILNSCLTPDARATTLRIVPL
jgi:hypothetical protein